MTPRLHGPFGLRVRGAAVLLSTCCAWASLMAVASSSTSDVRDEAASRGSVDQAPASIPSIDAAKFERVERMALREDSPMVRKVNAVLRLDRVRGRTCKDVAEELAALGAPAIQPAFAILAGTVPGPLLEGSRMPPPGTPQPEAVIVAAFALLDARDVARHVVAQVSGGSTVETKVVALRVLAEAGGEGGLDAWLEIVEGFAPESLKSPVVLQACQSAISGVMGRDTRAWNRLGSRAGSRAVTLPAQLEPLLWQGLAGSRRAQGIGVLLDALAHPSGTTHAAAHERERRLLSCLADLVETTTGDLTDDELARIRPFAFDADLRLRHDAIVTLARVGAGRDYAPMVDALSSPDPTLRDAGRWALERLSGADLGDDASAWTRWFEEQWTWFGAQADRLHRAIEIREPAKSVDAARALASRRLFRHHASREIVDLCVAGDANLVRQACVLLREIGSPAALPGLVEVLDNDDPSLRDVVRGTLCLLTGLKAPAERDAWKRALRLN